MNTARQPSYYGEEEKNFLRALLYFDIFNYPLSAEEVALFSPAIVNSSPHQALASLVSQKLLFEFQNFYSLHDDAQLVLRRIKGNALADKKMKVARRFSRIVSFFPFVRAIMLSGSISKGYMDKNSDIDYFIVTETNRLWLVRAALAIFRRVFLFNSSKNLCTNYFVDIQNLEIKDKNIFTAIELRTTKPMFGQSIIEEFQQANEWAFSYLPNYIVENEALSEKKNIIKTAIEKIFSFKGIDRFNEWIMNKSLTYWKRRYGRDVHPSDFETAFRSTAGISKGHPQFFQKKILTSYNQKIKDFETKNRIDLSL